MSRSVKGISSEKLALFVGDGWQNFSFGRDGLFYVDGWRRGFEPGELRAQFFQVQMIAALRHQEARSRAEMENAIQDAMAADKRAAWYRNQLVLESKMGLALARIAG